MVPWIGLTLCKEYLPLNNCRSPGSKFNETTLFDFPSNTLFTSSKFSLSLRIFGAYWKTPPEDAFWIAKVTVKLFVSKCHGNPLPSLATFIITSAKGSAYL